MFRCIYLKVNYKNVLVIVLDKITFDVKLPQKIIKVTLIFEIQKNYCQILLFFV